MHATQSGTTDVEGAPLIRLREKIIIRVMVAFIAFLVVASVVVNYLTAAGYQLYGPHLFFNLNAEGNLPAWYASTTLLFASFLLLMIGRSERRGRRGWLGLSAIFFFLAVDEAAAFHELFIGPVRRLLGVSGVLYWAWVIPWAMGLVVLAAVYARWFWNLPLRTRMLGALAATLYVSGAMGMEMVGGVVASRGEEYSPLYAILVGIEETLEMCGVLVWIYALMDYGRRVGAQITIAFAAPAAVPVAATTAPGAHSLESERLNRVEVSGLAGGIIPEKDTYRHREPR